MILSNIEFYGTPSGEVLISEGNSHKLYEIEDRAFTDAMLDYIQNFYAEAYKALCECYSKSKLNRTYFEYLIVRRFIKCNFLEYDNKNDIDENESLNFEFVPCPLRNECKYCNIICSPKFNTSLSESELRVMKLYYKGLKKEEIAENLYLSILTVQTHKRNVFTKLKINSLSEFIIFANNNKLFR